MVKKKKTVAVDLDGVLIQYRGWLGVDHFGEPIRGAREFLEKLREIAEVMLHTTRLSPAVNPEHSEIELQDMVDRALIERGLPYDQLWVGAGKPIASAYVDDRAVICNPQDVAPAFRHREFEAALQAVKRLIAR